MNRCTACGKFKAWHELQYSGTPDSEDGPETIEFICTPCLAERVADLGRRMEEYFALQAQRDANAKGETVTA